MLNGSMPPATRSPKAPGDASKQRNDTDEIEQRRKAHRQQHLKRWSPPRHSIEWHEVGATWAASCRRKAAFLPTSASAASAAHSGSRDVNRLITLCRLYEVPSQSGFPVLRGRGRVCSHPSTREGRGGQRCLLPTLEDELHPDVLSGWGEDDREWSLRLAGIHRPVPVFPAFSKACCAATETATETASKLAFALHNHSAQCHIILALKEGSTSKSLLHNRLLRNACTPMGIGAEVLLVLVRCIPI